ncbi:Hpt protein [Candidatus Magnetomorum sp. HK-1]|nr:Hpt protein [Candidatus Magnetomorum sp. HK-1]
MQNLTTETVVKQAELMPDELQQNKLILNIKSVMIRLDGNQFLLKELYRIYLKQIKIYMQDIEKSLAEGDFNQMATCSHSLKSCFQSIGAELCEDVNDKISKQLKTGDFVPISKLIESLKNHLEQVFMMSEQIEKNDIDPDLNVLY